MTTTTTASRGQTSRAGVKIPSIPPNQTLYVTNLPSSKINKADLKTALYMLFSTYGPVLDVVALKTMKMRGQAHIVFRDLQAATQALRSLEGFKFLGAELHLQYAKSKSDVIAKLDGTYKLPGSSAANVEMTEAQQSIFNAPAHGTSTTTGPTATISTPSNLNSKPARGSDQVMTDAKNPDARGQKRPRDEEEEEEESDEDVAMEEDSDDE
ncbi:RNA-binding domain-containing protein [Annulohypoxylon maeteangense]|uniref:RNA-binding domain-containing protein n=1 Tax=Annulohypoxylon maeteangense TaxID=1927788 RepID=UPI002008AD04|nr:RNA-binding domain-containing protein [Annulohypoxylon maeteangense]KAI0882696.1 RNA-binding domain-containing protein [Annulohypoxylon maeteangense]